MKVKSLLKIALGSLILASCATEMEEIPAEEQYLRDFIKKYGLIDPNQNWNLAVRITAEVDGAAVKGAKTVNVYTAKPGSEDCKLAARYAADVKSFQFDFPRSADRAYVVAYDDVRNIVLSGYCEIEAGKISITHDAVKSRAAGDINDGYDLSNPPTLGDKIADLGTIKDPLNRFPKVESDGDGNKKRTDIFNMYHLNSTSNFKFDGSKWELEDLIDLLDGEVGVFPESYVDPETGYCNLLRWEKVLNMDVEMVTASDGPVSFGLMCGGTDNPNKYGYIYYSGNTTLTGDELKNYIARQNRYILIEDGQPKSNIKLSGGNWLLSNMQVPTLFRYKDESWAQSQFPLTASRYYLTYYGEDGTGEPTFDFPANTHIVFFEIIKGVDTDNPGLETELNGEAINYSLPWMNEWTAHTRSEAHDNSKDYSKEPAIRFVKFGWMHPHRNEKVYLVGVEDGPDDDMNDIMFIVNGDFDDDTRLLKPGDDPEHLDDPEPESQSWIIAVEDLGETDDYDFNDLVLEVSHVSGETTATVKALAAGGIMEIYVKHDKLGEKGHVNGWFGETDHTVMINTQGDITKQHNGFTIEVPADFTLTGDDMGGFSFVVKKEDGTEVAIKPSSVKSENKGEAVTAPLMICVPGDWEWPKERVSIETAYPDFKKWVTDSSNSDWVKSKVADQVISRKK